MTWEITNKADVAVARLADRHYSRQTPGSRQFAPPGMTLVLYVPGPRWPFEVAAGWVWWCPHRNAPTGRMDGHDGYVCCTLFRNEGGGLSSDLVREATDIALQVFPPTPVPLRGLDTYVWPARVRSTNPGCCYQKAGWVRGGVTKDGKKLRWFLPMSEAL